MPTATIAPTTRHSPLRSTSAARWSVKTSPTPADARLAAQCDISPVTAAILRTRGYATPEAVRCFLDPDLCGLRDPLNLPDIRPAIERLHRAITAKEPMLIYGDYDVDGVTSTAMLVRSLRALGADVRWKIPERKDEGYGLSTGAMEVAAKQGASLVVTADCGIRDTGPVRRARDLGLDVIVTDHHEPGAELPPALAVINPKRADSIYGFSELSGCGVAFKMMQALLQEYWPQFAPSFWEKFVELAGMAAIADCVPLIDENRILAREGLRRLTFTRKRGLQALKEVARLKVTGSSLRGSHVGFGLAPRLNAAGRLDTACKSLQLLLSEPELIPRCRIVLMGGQWSAEQVEWNIWCDPEAAAIVFNSGADITMIGLDVTLRCKLAEEHLQRIARRSTAQSDLLTRLIQLWQRDSRRAVTLHDPLAVLSLFDDCVTFEEKCIVPVLCGVQRGITRAIKAMPNARVAVDVDVKRAIHLFEQRVLG